MDSDDEFVAPSQAKRQGTAKRPAPVTKQPTSGRSAKNPCTRTTLNPLDINLPGKTKQHAAKDPADHQHHQRQQQHRQQQHSQASQPHHPHHAPNHSPVVVDLTQSINAFDAQPSALSTPAAPRLASGINVIDFTEDDDYSREEPQPSPRPHSAVNAVNPLDGEDDEIEDDDTQPTTTASASRDNIPQELQEAVWQLRHVGDPLHTETLPGTSGRFVEPTMLPPPLQQLLALRGTPRLYSHQAEAYQHVMAGRSVVVSTPTASGKSLVFYLPVLQALSATDRARALFLYPLKALAGDQLKALQQYAQQLQEAVQQCDMPEPQRRKALDRLQKASICRYDGDSSMEERKEAQKKARVLLTNPDMLHVGLLPNHHLWSTFLGNLKYIIIDEAHHYKGVFGSHLGLVLRRLLRVCRQVYRSQPQIIAASATIGNPSRHLTALTTHEMVCISQSGAPSGPKSVLFLRPPEGHSHLTCASKALATLVGCGLNTLAFVPARKLAEIVARSAAEKRPDLAHMIDSYRAGYQAKDRRELEGKLAAGVLKGLVSTSALELGIDIGQLDATVHLGLPASKAALWQQAGRAGRRQRGSLAVVVETGDPLTRFYMSNPRQYFDRGFEEVQVYPDNVTLLHSHLHYAAHELPLAQADLQQMGPSVQAVVQQLAAEGHLLLDPATRCWRPPYRPGNYCSLRSSQGEPFRVVRWEGGKWEVVEEVEAHMAYERCHPGAILLHRTDVYRVARLDVEARSAYVEAASGEHYTQPRVQMRVAVAESLGAVESKAVGGGLWMHYGWLQVGKRVNGYKQLKLQTAVVECECGLQDQLPEVVLSTQGMWLDLPAEAEQWLMQQQSGSEVLTGVVNLMLRKLHQRLGCEPEDVGARAYCWFEPTQRSQIFLYDCFEGGMGLVRRTFEAEEVQGLLRDMLAGLTQKPRCCSTGCPCCIQGTSVANQVDLQDDLVGELKRSCKLLTQALLGEGPICGSPEAVVEA